MAIDDRIFWEDLIPQQAENSDVQEYVDGLSATESGNLVHEWITDEFDDLPVDYETNIAWLNEQEEVERGKYDAFDGDFVYEFKTKSEHGMLTAPYSEDIKQLEGYMDALSADDGVLVYINRDNLTEVDEYLVPSSN